MKWEATHMNSTEGENIMFLSSTILEGPVEVSQPDCVIMWHRTVVALWMFSHGVCKYQL